MGDQLLWEIKNAEGSYAQQAGGTVSYTHGGGIDRPLAIWRSGVGSIIPHENWRGQMARGTYGYGHVRQGQSSDCTQYPPGDPVSYSDPYGLCPIHLRRPDGSCPGGWSVPDYKRLSSLFSEGLKSGASAPLLSMLAEGGVRNEPMVGSEKRTQVHHYATDEASYIRIGPGFWKEGASAAAFMVAHEYGHVLQKEVRGLIYDSSTHMSLDEWNTITSDRGKEGSAFFNRTQKDANHYACQATVDKASNYHAEHCK